MSKFMTVITNTTFIAFFDMGDINVNISSSE